jgi:hypothetical protein
MPAAGQVTPEGVRCVNCDYDLRLLDITGKCPECGEPIVKSLQLNDRRAADWNRDAIACGMLLLVWIWPPASQVLLLMTNWWRAAFIVWTIPFGLCWWAASLLSRRHVHEHAASLQIAVRWGLRLLLLILAIFPVFPFGFEQFSSSRLESFRRITVIIWAMIAGIVIILLASRLAHLVRACRRPILGTVAFILWATSAWSFIAAAVAIARGEDWEYLPFAGSGVAILGVEATLQQHTGFNFGWRDPGIGWREAIKSIGYMLPADSSPWTIFYFVMHCLKPPALVILIIAFRKAARAARKAAMAVPLPAPTAL